MCAAKESRDVSNPPKITVIGAGTVGATLAYTLTVEQVAGEVVLVDIDRDRAEGEAKDISHALPFSAPTRVRAGDYADCDGADLFIITAGVAQKSGESRLSLVERNVEIFKDIVPKMVDIAEDAIILVVSNPLDVLTYATLKISGLSPRRVFGSGTVLDTARFRYEIGTNCGVDPRNVHAYILGEHGDSEVPAWSRASIAGMPLRSFCDTCDQPRCSDEEMEAIFERVKNAAYEIIDLKGATYYAIALGATRMAQAILRNQHTCLTASVLLEGQYGIDDVCLSVPVILGRDGIERILEIPLSDDERDALQNSGQVLRDVLEKVGY